MKYFSLLVTLVLAMTFQSCNKDEHDVITNDLVGTWKLTSWNVEGGFDINSDGVINSNLLTEIECENEEILIFESNGTVSSYKTYNPFLQISLMDGTADHYIFNVECPEGTIGFSVSYSQQNGFVTIQDKMATINNNQLTRIFDNAIEIYNQDFTQVVATKTLTMVYTKQ